MNEVPVNKRSSLEWRGGCLRQEPLDDPKNWATRIDRRRQQTIIKMFHHFRGQRMLLASAALGQLSPTTGPPDALAMSCRSLWLVQLVLMEIFIERHGAWRVVAGPTGPPVTNSNASLSCCVSSLLLFSPLDFCFITTPSQWIR